MDGGGAKSSTYASLRTYRTSDIKQLMSHRSVRPPLCIHVESVHKKFHAFSSSSRHWTMQ